MPVVLVAEDEAVVRVLAEGIVAGLGYETLSAGSLTEGSALFEHKVDLLFTDLAMGDDPDAGIALARTGREYNPDLRVIYTSARELTDGLKALFVEGGVFLPKPYTPEQLNAALVAILAPPAKP